MQRLTAHRRRPDQLRGESRPRRRGRVARYIYFGLLGLFVLALANVDLVYLRLSALLCAADRVLSTDEPR